MTIDTTDIDITKPNQGNALTQDVRGNFSAIKDHLDTVGAGYIDNAEAIPTLIGQTLSVNTSNLTKLSSRYSMSSIPHLYRALTEHNDATGIDLEIVGMGSSVGVGATLPDAATQAPVMKFGEYFDAKLNILNNKTVVTTNRSVNGSTISESLVKFDDIVAEPLIPKAVVLAYGMNDGASAIYHNGQTYPFVYSTILDLVRKAQAQNCDVILMTTPHPHTDRYTWSMPSGISMIYPSSVAADVPDESLIPPVSTSIRSVDVLGYGAGHEINISYRHYRVNEAMRKAAYECGIPVIDVEKYWFDAVYRNGEDALFDVGESNHPNLLGHTLSYWAAIDDFINSIAYQANQSNPQNHYLTQKTGINRVAPSATLDIAKDAAADIAFQVRDESNAVIMEVNAADEVDMSPASRVTLPTTTDISTGASIAGYAKFNVLIATPYTIPTTSNTGGTITINAVQSGIGRETQFLTWNNVAGTVTVAKVIPTGAGIVVTVSGDTSGNIVLTVIGDNTNINWSITSAGLMP